MVDYTGIKSMTKHLDCNAPDLLVLSNSNDPYYLTPGRVKAAYWFAEIAKDYPPGTYTRRIHYRYSSLTEAVRPDGRPYRNTKRDVSCLNQASRDARFLGLLEEGWLFDRKNDPVQINAQTFESPDGFYGVRDEILPPSELSFPPPPSLDFWRHDPDQDYVVEIWIEKDTQNDWLVPLCERRNVNLWVGGGETSEMACRDLVNRSKNKPVRILYISDFDPAGAGMPVAAARKIEFIADGLDLDITLEPICLTLEQVEHYRLPRMPIKEGERRTASFEERFGEGAVELDAMEAIHPGEMAKMLDAEISRYLDPNLVVACSLASSRAEEQAQEYTEYVHELFAERIEASQREFLKISSLHQAWHQNNRALWADIEEGLEEDRYDEEVPRPRPRPADEREDVMFDSKRDYLRQIAHYKRWQRKG